MTAETSPLKNGLLKGRLLPLFLCLQGLLLTVFYWPWICGQQNFFLEDLTYFFEPLCRFIGTRIAAGQLPLWNPYNYCGMSQAAIGSPGIFYPPNLLFAVFPFSTALALIMIMNQLVIGLGVFLLICSLGWGEIAALAGAISLSSCGFMFCLSNNYTLLATASWLPLCLFLLRGMLSEKNGTAFLPAFAICTGMMLLAGRPEIWFPALLILSLYAGYYCVACREKAVFIKSLLLAASAIAMGILIAMPSLLPTFEWLPLSRRSSGLDANEVLMFSANWYDLVCMVASQPLGDLQFRTSDFRPLVLLNNMGPYCSSAFLGPIVSTLCLLGFMRRGGLLYCLVISVGILTILGSLGANLPFAEKFVTQLPGLSLFRFPSKLLFFPSFCISLFSARGIFNYLQHKEIKLFSVLLIWTVLALTGLILLYADSILLPFISVYKANDAYMQTAISAQKNIAFAWSLWACIGLAFTLMLSFFQRVNKHLSGALISCLLVALSLYVHAFSYCHTGASSTFYDEKSVLAEKLRALNRSGKRHSGRFCSLYLERFTVPPAFNPGAKETPTEPAYQYTRQILRPFVNVDFKIPSAWGFEGAMNGEYYKLLSSSYLLSSQSLTAVPLQKRNDLPLYRLLQFSGCDFVITQSWRYLPNPIIFPNRQRTNVWKLDDSMFDLVVDDQENNLRVYALKSTLPRAYLSYRWRPARENSNAELFKEMQENFDDNVVSLGNEANSGPDEIEALTIEEISAEHLRIAFKAKEKGVLVLLDQFYPGWHCKLDGKDVPILKCNAFFRGVKVPSGKHIIDFLFEPLSVAVGVLSACIVLLFLFSWGFFVSARKKREYKD